MMVSLGKTLAKLRLDPFLLLIMLAVLLATLVPVRGDVARAVAMVTDVAIALLFFLHGAKLSRDAVIAGIRAPDGACRHFHALSAVGAGYPGRH